MGLEDGVSASTDTAAMFIVHDNLLAAAERAATTVRARNAWFRIAVLEDCANWRRTTADLMERLNISRTPSTRRVALRNLSNMTRGRFLERTDEGYMTTARGRRVLDDLAALSLDDADRRAI